MNLVVDVISDVICPWCYIGKRRHEKAIAALDGQHDVQVDWHPFQLNPTMPKEGISRKEYRTRKFGSWERSLELDAKVIAVGQTEGIQFAFDKIERTPNTVDAHRLIWLADQQGCQDAVVEALFRAYFTDVRNISNRQTLIDVVSEAGLDRQLAETIHTKILDLLKTQDKQWSDIQAVVCYKGPGSFTGLRIGISVANALASSLDVPIESSTGDDWIEISIKKIATKSFTSPVMPVYGTEVHITQPRT